MKQYFGADNLENWNGNEINIELLQTYYRLNTFLYVDQSTQGLTIGKLLARMLNKAYNEKETFWVSLFNLKLFCYDPCPDQAFSHPEPDITHCCRGEPITSTFEYKENENKPYCYDPCPDPNLVNSDSDSSCCSEQPITKTITPDEKYSFLTWSSFYNRIVLVQNYTQSKESIDCGSVEIKNTEQLDFYRENCKAKKRPLCMRFNNESDENDKKIVEINSNQRKRKTTKKKKTRKSNKKKANRRKVSSGRQGRQLTGTGRPIEMCATVLPALLGNNLIIIHKRLHGFRVSV